MWRDPIVEEVRRRREQYAAAFNYDIQAICRAARERQKASGKNVLSRPRRPATEHAARDRE